MTSELRYMEIDGDNLVHMDNGDQDLYIGTKCSIIGALLID